MLDETALLITACRRPDYLRRTLLSWAAADRVADLRVVAVALGASHRYDDQADVIREAEGWLGREIVVIRDSPEAQASPGMHRALGEGIDRLFDAFVPEFVICGEEDVIVSDDVLTYMAWAQAMYTENTLCICAHNKGGMGWDDLVTGPCDEAVNQETVRRVAYFNPWVWCTWRHTWRSVIRPVWDWDCDGGGERESGYDWGMQRLSCAGPWRNLVPDAARSQTIGQDGGVYSTPDIFASQQALSFRDRRDQPVQYRLADEALAR